MQSSHLSRTNASSSSFVGGGVPRFRSILLPFLSVCVFVCQSNPAHASRYLEKLLVAYTPRWSSPHLYKRSTARGDEDANAATPLHKCVLDSISFSLLLFFMFLVRILGSLGGGSLFFFFRGASASLPLAGGVHRGVVSRPPPTSIAYRVDVRLCLYIYIYISLFRLSLFLLLKKMVEGGWRAMSLYVWCLSTVGLFFYSFFFLCVCDAHVESMGVGVVLGCVCVCVWRGMDTC